MARLVSSPKAVKSVMRSFKRGFTILEFLISLLLLTLVFTGAMAFYFYSNQYLQASFHRRVAAEIANSAMEQIKKDGYSGLPHPAPGSGLWLEDAVNIRGLSGVRRIYVSDLPGAEYKQVTVEIDWQEPAGAQARNIQLVTYVSP